MPTFQENVRRCLNKYVGEKIWAGAWDRRSDRTELLPINVRPVKGDIVSGYHRIKMPNSDHRFFVCRFIKNTLGPAAAFVPPFKRKDDEIVPDDEWTKLSDWAEGYGLAIRVYTDKMNVVYTGDAHIFRRGINYFVALTERSLEKCLSIEGIKKFIDEDDDYSVMISIEKNFRGEDPESNIKSSTSFFEIKDTSKKKKAKEEINKLDPDSSLVFVNGTLRRSGYTDLQISDVVEITSYNDIKTVYKTDDVYTSSPVYTKDSIDRYIIHVNTNYNRDNQILPFRDMIITAYSPENPDGPGLWMHIDDFDTNGSNEKIFQLTHNDISITKPAVDRLKTELEELLDCSITQVKLEFFFRVHDPNLKMGPNGAWTDVLYGSGLTNTEILEYLQHGELSGGVAQVSEWTASSLEDASSNTLINGPYPSSLNVKESYKAIGSHHIPEVLGLIRKKQMYGYFSSITVDLPSVLTNINLSDNVKIDLWIKGKKVPRDWLSVTYTNDQVTISPVYDKEDQLKYAGFGSYEVIVRFTPYFGSEEDKATTYEVDFDVVAGLSEYNSEDDSPLTFFSDSDMVSVYVNGRRLSEGFDLISLDNNVWQIINADFFKNYWLRTRLSDESIFAKLDDIYLTKTLDTIEVIESPSSIIGTGTNIPNNNSSGFSIPGWYAGGANYHAIRGSKNNGLIFRDGIPVHGVRIPGPIQNDGDASTFNFIGIAHGCEIDFNNYQIRSYYAISSNQDNGTASIEDNGFTLRIENNAWKLIEYQYEITENTVLEFDFLTSDIREIHAIGMRKTDNDVETSEGIIFKLYGTQGWAGPSNHDYVNLSNEGEWYHYVIPIGTYYTGKTEYMVFVADDDGLDSGNGVYSNIRVYENKGLNNHCSELERTYLYGRHVETEIVLPKDVVTMIDDYSTWINNQSDLASKVFTFLRRNAPSQSSADKIARPRELYSPLVHRCMRDLSANTGLYTDVNDNYNPANPNPESFIDETYKEEDPFVDDGSLILPWDQSFVDILPSYKNYPLNNKICWLYIRDLLRYYVYSEAEGTPEVLGGLRWSGYINH